MNYTTKTANMKKALFLVSTLTKRRDHGDAASKWRDDESAEATATKVPRRRYERRRFIGCRAPLHPRVSAVCYHIIVKNLTV